MIHGLRALRLNPNIKRGMINILEEYLLPIGSIVVVESTEDIPQHYMVIGHRIVNHESMKAWDYISVGYPEGLKRYFKHDKEFDHDDYFYFNHYEIERVIHKNTVSLEKD